MKNLTSKALAGLSIFLAFVGTPGLALAVGPGTTGGGNPEEADFVSKARNIVVKLRALRAEEALGIPLGTLEDAVEGTQVQCAYGKFVQIMADENKKAYYDSESATIWLDCPNYHELSGSTRFEVVVAHEYMRKLGLETSDYRYSGRLPGIFNPLRSEPAPTHGPGRDQIYVQRATDFLKTSERCFAHASSCDNIYGIDEESVRRDFKGQVSELRLRIHHFETAIQRDRARLAELDAIGAQSNHPGTYQLLHKQIAGIADTKRYWFYLSIPSYDSVLADVNTILNAYRVAGSDKFERYKALQALFTSDQFIFSRISHFLTAMENNAGKEGIVMIESVVKHIPLSSFTASCVGVEIPFNVEFLSKLAGRATENPVRVTCRTTLLGHLPLNVGSTTVDEQRREIRLTNIDFRGEDEGEPTFPYGQTSFSNPQRIRWELAKMVHFESLMDNRVQQLLKKDY